MRKSDRHNLIKQLIKEEQLSTQKDIQDRLEERGVVVTQTTLSRDMRELGLTKMKKNDQTYYILADETAKIDLLDFLAYHLQGVARAEFTLVLHTRLGEASVLANVVDDNRGDLILGSLAGANTLLLICRDVATASQMEQELLEKMEEV